MVTIKNYATGKPITLFDYSRDGRLEGVMYFAAQAITQPIKRAKAKTSARWVDERYTKPKADILNFKSLAIVCLLFAILGFISLVLPIVAAEAKYRFSFFQKSASSLYKLASASESANAKFISSFEYLSKKNQPESQEFRIAVSKINLESKVLPDVDPSIDTNYQDQLKDAVAHARGSYLPGQKGLVFLFAHSTDTPDNILQYNAKFYGLKDLENGDQIDIFYHGKHYTYEIYDKKVTDPFDLETIRSSTAALILQTCWPPGTDWQRLMIFAKEI